jgi:hypothetical protein
MYKTRFQLRVISFTRRLTSYVKATLRLTVRQSVSLGVEPHLGPMTRYLLLFDTYGFFLWGALSDERTDVFCIRCWSLKAQSFS